MHKISIILVNYNVKHFIALAIDAAIQALHGIDYEIWVVDNASKEEAKEYILNLFPQINWIQNSENRGFSAANNQAITASNSEYILLLNPDTVVSETTFQRVIDYMDHHPKIGALGIRMIDGSGTFLPESKRGFPSPKVAFFKAFGFSKLFPKSSRFSQYHLGYLPNTETNTVDVLSGAFMLLRSSVLEKSGLLSEDYFMYGEDIDLSYCIQKAGYQNVYFADDTIIHFKGESTKRGSLKFVKTFYGAMVIFARKHLTGIQKTLFKLFIWPAIWFRASLSLGNSALKTLGSSIIDTLMIYTCFRAITYYWERNVLYTPETYSDLVLYVYLPIYTLILVGFLWMFGAYKSNSTANKSLKGGIYGLLFLTIIYSLLPISLRFSRAILILGGLLSTLLVTGRRLISKDSITSLLGKSAASSEGVYVYGTEQDLQTVKEILIQEQKQFSFISRIQSLGIIQKHPPKECVLGQSVLSNSDIIRTLEEYGRHTNMSILPKFEHILISSTAKHTNGQVSGKADYKLHQYKFRSIKHLFSICLAFTLIILYPILPKYLRIKCSIQQLCNVLIGRLLLVETPSSEYYRKGVLHVTNESGNLGKQLIETYLKDYQMVMDLNVLLRKEN